MPAGALASPQTQAGGDARAALKMAPFSSLDPPHRGMGSPRSAPLTIQELGGNQWVFGGLREAQRLLDQYADRAHGRSKWGPDGVRPLRRVLG